jgi:hypothetical protein
MNMETMIDWMFWCGVWSLGTFAIGFLVGYGIGEERICHRNAIRNAAEQREKRLRPSEWYDEEK